MSFLIDSYVESNQSTQSTIWSGRRYGQSFTGIDCILDSAKFYLKKTGLPTGSAVAKVYSHSGTYGTSSVGNTLLATSDNFDVSTLTTSFALVTFNFTTTNRITITDGTYYFIAIEYSSGTSDDNVVVGIDNTSPTHDGNSAYYIASWTAVSGNDTIFYVYGDDVDRTISVNDSIYQDETYGPMVGDYYRDQGNTFDLEYATTNYYFGSNPDVKVAQSFTPDSTAEIAKIRLLLNKNNNPDGGVRLKLYTNDAGNPGTLLSTSDTVSTSQIGLLYHESYKLVTFTFSRGTRLLEDTLYWFVIESTSTPDASNYWYAIAYTLNETSYPNGTTLYSNGTSWYDDVGDYWFEQFNYESEISVVDSIVIPENVRVLPQELKVWLDGIDCTRYISQDGFRIENILTSQVDKCTFSISRVLNSSILNYEPTIGHDIQVSYQGEKIFAGVITRVNKYLDSNSILVYNCECEDYTKFLDRKLVAKSYTGMTVNAIIADINTNYLTGFTLNNVDCDITIDYIGFNYIAVSKALAKLADLVHFDWYVDYDKDIHFFSKTSNIAPFTIIDTDGSYNTNSMRFKQDNSQVRNVIYVRGGEYLGPTFTTEITGDGVKEIYNIPYRYKDLTCTLTGQPQSVGLDYIDSANDFDVLWNYQEKLLRWKSADKPGSGKTIRVGGRPYLPVRLKTRNLTSIKNLSATEGGDGIYEYLIIDDSIKTKEAALERADAELTNYKNTLVEGEFETYKDGLKAGQYLRIQSDLYNMDESYLINQVTIQMFTPTKLVYNVKLISTKTYGLIEYLQDLLLRDNKKLLDIGENVETIDVVESLSEIPTIADTVTTNFNTEYFGDVGTVLDTFTSQPLDYPVGFRLSEFTRALLSGNTTPSATTAFDTLALGSNDGKFKLRIYGETSFSDDISVDFRNLSTEILSINPGESTLSGLNPQYLGQSFTTSSTTRAITKISLYIGTAFTQNSTLYLRSGSMTGTIIGTVQYPNIGSQGWKDYVFSSEIEVSPNTTYYIDMSGTSGGSQEWWYGNAYAGGTAYFYSGSWGAQAYDLAFKVYVKEHQNLSTTIISEKVETGIVGYTGLGQSVSYSTNKYIITGDLNDKIIYELSTPVTGTDISGDGATPYLDMGTGSEITKRGLTGNAPNATSRAFILDGSILE